jgi:hypothetical protein
LKNGLISMDNEVPEITLDRVFDLASGYCRHMLRQIESDWGDDNDCKESFEIKWRKRLKEIKELQNKINN